MTASACAARSSTGLVAGLGDVTATSTWLASLEKPPCAAFTGRALGHSVELAVASKGRITVSIAEASACVELEQVRVQTQAFTITGGTGVYTGASGSGTVERSLGFLARGTEAWTGSLVVPSLEFDVTRRP